MNTNGSHNFIGIKESEITNRLKGRKLTNTNKAKNPSVSNKWDDIFEDFNKLENCFSDPINNNNWKNINKDIVDHFCSRLRKKCGSNQGQFSRPNNRDSKEYDVVYEIWNRYAVCYNANIDCLKGIYNAYRSHLETNPQVRDFLNQYCMETLTNIRNLKEQFNSIIESLNGFDFKDGTADELVEAVEWPLKEIKEIKDRAISRFSSIQQQIRESITGDKSLIFAREGSNSELDNNDLTADDCIVTIKNIKSLSMSSDSEDCLLGKLEIADGEVQEKDEVIYDIESFTTAIMDTIDANMDDCFNMFNGKDYESDTATRLKTDISKLINVLETTKKAGWNNMIKAMKGCGLKEEEKQEVENKYKHIVDTYKQRMSAHIGNLNQLYASIQNTDRREFDNRGSALSFINNLKRQLTSSIVRFSNTAVHNNLFNNPDKPINYGSAYYNNNSYAYNYNAPGYYSGSKTYY